MQQSEVKCFVALKKQKQKSRRRPELLDCNKTLPFELCHFMNQLNSMNRFFIPFPPKFALYIGH